MPTLRNGFRPTTMALTKIELATSQLMTMVGQMQNLVNAIDVSTGPTC